jgi:uncharacterized membrane protein
MAFCVQCGAEAPGNFCPRCGASISEPAAAGGYPAGAQAGYAPPPPGAVTSAGMSTNTASALCYLVGLVTGIIFLVLDPYNKNKTVRFHAFQSIFFHVGVIVAMIALTILGSFLSLLTHGLAGLLTLVLWPLLMLAIFVLWLYLMWAAYNNKMVVLPIVGPLAQKQA